MGVLAEHLIQVTCSLSSWVSLFASFLSSTWKLHQNKNQRIFTFMSISTTQLVLQKSRKEKKADSVAGVGADTNYWKKHEKLLQDVFSMKNLRPESDFEGFIGQNRMKRCRRKDGCKKKE